MRLRFTTSFNFFKNNEPAPFLSFSRDEEIKVFCPAELDYANFLTQSLVQHRDDFKPCAAYWAEAKNGITVWKSIDILLRFNILEVIG